MNFLRSLCCPMPSNSAPNDEADTPPKPVPVRSPKPLTAVSATQKPSLSKDDIRRGLEAALAGEEDIAAFPNKLLYQFEDAKPYNLDIPIIPAAVTYPRTAEHISKIVKYAASVGLKVQARSGGHSYGNYCIGGVSGAIVIDMKNFQQFSMDESTWNATFGAGTNLGDVTERLFNAGGRAIAHGVCPQVGAGGHLTIGGLGPASRMWGSALDHVIGMQVVLADGSIVRASTTENPDVFWACKGAGASFGVVTEFTVLTHPAPGEMVHYSFDIELGSHRSTASTFRNWQNLASKPDLSRKLYTQVTVTAVGMVVSGTFFGPQSEFDALDLESVFPHHRKKHIIVIKDWLALVTQWTADIGLHLVGGIPCAFYGKFLAIRASDLIPSACIDDLFEYLDKADKGTLLWFFSFELQGGAINDIPTDATAYAHRDILYYVETFGIDIGRVSSTTRNFLRGAHKLVTDAMPNAKFANYPGYVDPELPNGQEAYWAPNLTKLEAIKRSIDPKDVFHNPQSVRPAAS